MSFRFPHTPLDRYVVTLIRLQQNRVLFPFVRFILYLLGMEVYRTVKIGPGLELVHPLSGGLTLHQRTVIGANVTIFHGVTIGRSDPWVEIKGMTNKVVIEDDVILCCGAVVLFRGGRDTI